MPRQNPHKTAHHDRTSREANSLVPAAAVAAGPSHALAFDSHQRPLAKPTLGSGSNGGDHGQSTVTKSMTAASQLTDSHSNPFASPAPWQSVAAVVDYGAGLGDWWWWWWWWRRAVLRVRKVTKPYVLW